MVDSNQILGFVLQGASELVLDFQLNELLRILSNKVLLPSQVVKVFVVGLEALEVVDELQLLFQLRHGVSVSLRVTIGLRSESFCLTHEAGH